MFKSFLKRRFRGIAVSTQPNLPGEYTNINQSSRNQNSISQGEFGIANPNSDSTIEQQNFTVGVAQSMGIERDHNEDAIFTLTSHILSAERNIQYGLYGIADGMGGHEHGEIASRIAITQFASTVTELLYLKLISPEGYQPDLSMQEVMQSAVNKSHEMIKIEIPGGGTTLTAVLLLGDQLTVTHVGDSRAYLVNRDGTIQQLTQDHSVVKRLEEIGQISAEEANSHPQRNFLYKALGQTDSLEPDIRTVQLQSGNQVILCSDGLWSVIPEQEVLDSVLSASSPQQACQSLVSAANQAGGPDNISVIIVKIQG